MYNEEKLVRIAKRENNNKRKYLVVNALQGKHIPVSPKESFDMFDALAEIVSKSYNNEKLLLVGFAETATAIGASLAVKLDTYYMQTTREIIDNVDYLFFTESHSHATEQKLVKNDIDKIINKIDRIVFIEDEVTTGNTILGIVNIIKKIYGDSIRFSVASLLNGMDENSLDMYKKYVINVHYLVKTNHSAYTQISEGFAGDGQNFICNDDSIDTDIAYNSYDVFGDYINARCLTKGSEYLCACESLVKQIQNKLPAITEQKVLVIGTEEFMYPALFVAKKLEEDNNTVKCHSTTRSPITVSTEKKYPLHIRYQLTSFYDDSRTTFIYDLNNYDKVIIITDSKNKSSAGINSLINAVASCGNSDITIFRWC